MAEDTQTPPTPTDPVGLAAGVTKTESDGQHAAAHYLVVEDAAQSSTWHLRVRGLDGQPDHTLMGAAWAALHGGYRGNKYAGPDAAGALTKLKALYAAEKMPEPGADAKAAAADADDAEDADAAPHLADAPPLGATDTRRVLLGETGSIQPAHRGRTYRAVAIRPGEWKGHGLYCPADVLRRGADKFNGLASFLNPGPAQSGQHGHPAIQSLLGVFDNAHWDEAEQAVVGDYHLADTPVAGWFKGLADGMIAARAAGRRVPDVGLSAVPWVRVTGARSDGLREVGEILGVEQLDAVYKPAAGGAIQRILAAQPNRGNPMDEDTTMISPPAAAPPAAAYDTTAAVQEELANELLTAQRGAVLTARLATSGLPAELQDMVAQSLPADWRVADLDHGVERARLAWSRLEESRTVRGVTPVTGMQDGLDRITEALTALLERRAPRTGTPPLSGIREAYIALSGDYEMTGVYQAERVQLANVNSTTMANIVANVLNKRVVQTFQTYPRWWEDIAVEEEFTTLQTIKWIKLGGLGSLPTVAEGAAYTELTWDDASETAAWTKKGGYLGLTLEAMDKDDVNRLRSAPLALAQAAYLTLAKDISAIFTSNAGVGPTLADSLALFEAGTHANLGTSALTAASWNATRIAMRKQTELHSSERLGGLVVPKFLLVPPDLEQTGLIILGSEGYPGTGNNDVNPEASGANTDARLAAARRRLVVVDFWTDTNNWAAVGDPRLYPGIGIGYRFGKTPEIFSVASPTSGLMFTNDTMPIKVRWLYAVGAIDYRPLYKQNVA